MKLFRHTFKVRGSGRLPSDLLRLERAYPHQVVDAALADAPINERDIVLAHVSPLVDWRPNGAFRCPGIWRGNKRWRIVTQYEPVEITNTYE